MSIESKNEIFTYELFNKICGILSSGEVRLQARSHSEHSFSRVAVPTDEGLAAKQINFTKKEKAAVQKQKNKVTAEIFKLLTLIVKAEQKLAEINVYEQNLVTYTRAQLVMKRELADTRERQRIKAKREIQEIRERYQVPDEERTPPFHNRDLNYNRGDIGDYDEEVDLTEPRLQQLKQSLQSRIKPQVLSPPLPPLDVVSQQPTQPQPEFKVQPQEGKHHEEKHHEEKHHEEKYHEEKHGYSPTLMTHPKPDSSGESTSGTANGRRGRGRGRGGGGVKISTSGTSGTSSLSPRSSPKRKPTEDVKPRMTFDLGEENDDDDDDDEGDKRTDLEALLDGIDLQNVKMKKSKRSKKKVEK